jgi:hypothetical protein
MLASWGGAKRQKSSIELMLSKRAMEVWFIAVPNVGAGGFVGPWVPVAMTPAGNGEAAACTEVTAEETRSNEKSIAQWEGSGGGGERRGQR